MNKARFFFISTATLLIGFVVSYYACAQPWRIAYTSGDAVRKRHEQLTADLTARGDTNTLKQISALLASKDTLVNTKDAMAAVALLQYLRAGRTNDAIQMLESQLDGALVGIAFNPEDVGEAQLLALKLAKQYRTNYPMETNSPGVRQALDLLEKRAGDRQ